MKLEDLNDAIVKLRKPIKQAQVHIINHLSRRITQLKSCRTDSDDMKMKNERKAERFKREIALLQPLRSSTIAKNTIAKFILKNRLTKVDDVPEDKLEERAYLRLALHKSVKTFVEHFRSQHSNWKQETGNLLVILGRKQDKKSPAVLKAKVEATHSKNEALKNSHIFVHPIEKKLKAESLSPAEIKASSKLKKLKKLPRHEDDTRFKMKGIHLSMAKTATSLPDSSKEEGTEDCSHIDIEKQSMLTENVKEDLDVSGNVANDDHSEDSESEGKSGFFLGGGGKDDTTDDENTENRCSKRTDGINRKQRRLQLKRDGVIKDSHVGKSSTRQFGKHGNVKLKPTFNKNIVRANVETTTKRVDKPTTGESLHPSWAAKKSQSVFAESQGRKIVFN